YKVLPTLLQLLEHRARVRVCWVELDRAQVRLARVITPVCPGVGFAKAVEHVRRSRILLRVQLEDADRARDITHAQQCVSQTVQLSFPEVIRIRLGRSQTMIDR